MITNCTKNSVSSSNENANTYNGQWLLTNRNIFDSILVFKKIEIEQKEQQTTGLTDGQKLFKFIIAGMAMHSGIVAFFP